ncbi:MAG: DUF1566 domain-containing protein [Proteobacteria bacterium]|nr:DUF1566 domain-containing protein [Pseudomonadota bacterium]
MKKIFLIVMAGLLAATADAAEMWLNDHTATQEIPANILEWQRGESEKTTWENAVDYCDDLDLADNDDWRLPIIQELFLIVNYEKYQPAGDNTNFPYLNATYYWSSTTYANKDSYAWMVSFSYGGVRAGDKKSKNFVRCVRQSR